MALAADAQMYVPPRNVRQMEKDLKLFPLAWAEDGDAVLGEEDGLGNEGKRDNIDFSQYVPKPWGWSKSLKHRLLRLGVLEENMPSDEQLDWWRRWSSREFAAKYIQRFLGSVEQRNGNRTCDVFVGEDMRFCESVSDLRFQKGQRMILKSPWSSSGRGVFVAENMNEKTLTRIEGVLRNQGGILVDRYYHKVLDFALEFDAQASGKVVFLGYSVFQAAEDGKYGWNKVARQEELEQDLLNICGKDAMEWLTSTISLHQKLLEEEFRGRYVGPVGIDMLVVHEEGKQIKIHPCIEINLRMNMGIVAIHLADKLEQLRKMVEEGMSYEDCRKHQRFRFLDFLPEEDFKSFILSSTRLPLSPMREHGFQASVEGGKLVITFCS